MPTASPSSSPSPGPGPPGSPPLRRPPQLWLFLLALEPSDLRPCPPDPAPRPVPPPRARAGLVAAGAGSPSSRAETPRRAPPRPSVRAPPRASRPTCAARFGSRGAEVPATLLTEFLNPPEPRAKYNPRAPRSAGGAAVSRCREAARSPHCHTSGLDVASPPARKSRRMGCGVTDSGAARGPRGALCSPRLSGRPVADARHRRPQADPQARHPSASRPCAPRVLCRCSPQRRPPGGPAPSSSQRPVSTPSHSCSSQEIDSWAPGCYGDRQMRTTILELLLARGRAPLPRRRIQAPGSIKGSARRCAWPWRRGRPSAGAAP